VAVVHAVAAIFYVISGPARVASALARVAGAAAHPDLVLLPLTFYLFPGGRLGPAAGEPAGGAGFTLLLAGPAGGAADWPGPAPPARAYRCWAGSPQGILWVREALGWAATHAPPGLDRRQSRRRPCCAGAARHGACCWRRADCPLRGLAALVLPAPVPALDRAPREGFQLTAWTWGRAVGGGAHLASTPCCFDAGPPLEDISDAGRSVIVPYLLGDGVHEIGPDDPSRMPTSTIAAAHPTGADLA